MELKTPTGSLFSAEEMEEISSSLFGPTALSAHKVRSTFIYGPAEKSAVLTVATLLARNVYHIGGTLAVPQKCRHTQYGKLMFVYVCVCVCVCKSRHYNSVYLTEGNQLKLTIISESF